MERRQRRIFPESFKREAVDRVATIGLSAGRVAAELGLHETVLRRWMSHYAPAQATGTPRRPNTQAAAPSPSDLVAEVARLRPDDIRLLRITLNRLGETGDWDFEVLKYLVHHAKRSAATPECIRAPEPLSPV